MSDRVTIAWDWHLPRETNTQERELVDFAAELGFDVLVVPDPTPSMVTRGDDLGVRIVAVVRAQPTDAFRDDHPECLQSIHPAEERIASALADDPEYHRRRAHRWYPHIHGDEFLCFEHDASLSFLERQVSDALETADGVALDGFGFRNHHACFCDRCERRRDERSDDLHELDALRRVSRDQLVETSRRLYDHAAAEAPDALVISHVWPPFDPEPDYGHRLHLDYCLQTVSWFYRPNRSLDRIEFETKRHARLAGETNEFVPFVGLFDDPYQRRSPDRLARELEIATECANGSVAISTLGVPFEHPEYARVIKATIA